jgi:hypothetical protein
MKPSRQQTATYQSAKTENGNKHLYQTLKVAVGKPCKMISYRFENADIGPETPIAVATRSRAQFVLSNASLVFPRLF